jgi:long-chain acyl-CoA synthetase
MSNDKPWLQFYEPHVPEHIDYPRKTIVQAMDETAKKFANDSVIIFKDRKMTYREMMDGTNRFAAALQNLGVKKGDRVAIHLLNMPQFMMTYYAILKIGAVVVPCNPVYTARELKHQLNDSGAEVIITLSLFYSTIKAIREETKLKHVIVAKIKTYFPPMLKILFTLAREKKDGHAADISGDANTYWFADLIANAPEQPEPVELSWDDTAVLMYTGGTTGVSKGAQLTHKNVFVNAYQVVIWVNALDEQNRMLTSLPLYHSYAMTCCMNAGAITGGVSILIPNPRDLDDVLKTINKHKPDFYPGVPALYVAINNHPDVSKYDLTSLRACNSGAAPLPLEVQQRFQEITGARLVEGYGLSEAW